MQEITHLNEKLEQQLADAEKQNQILREALQYYANKENWYPGDSFKQFCRIDENDMEYFPYTKSSDLIGGKLARQVLKGEADAN